MVVASAPLAWAEQRGQAKEQVEFGIQVAQRGLWKEAIYRWERATQLDPTYAAAFNNLAVAYEHEGQLAKAREAYEKALALEPNNALVRQNYDLFKEINDRAAQKDGRQFRRTAGGRGKGIAVPGAGGRPRGVRRSYTEIPIETPIQPKLDVTPFQRIFIAGFIAGANEDVDANMETVRLLRSQLRNKGIMRVIDADTLPLLEVAKQSGEASAPPVPDQQAVTPAQEQDPDKPPVFNDEKDLEPYNHIFANVAYWKRIGEEFQQPLIVTGAVLFAPQQRSGFVQREQEVYDSFGRRQVVPVRTYMERKGFVLRPDLHLHRRPHRRNPAQRDVPGRDPLQRQPADPGPVVVFRAHGPAAPGLP